MVSEVHGFNNMRGCYFSQFDSIWIKHLIMLLQHNFWKLRSHLSVDIFTWQHSSLHGGSRFVLILKRFVQSDRQKQYLSLEINMYLFAPQYKK